MGANFERRPFDHRYKREQYKVMLGPLHCCPSCFRIDFQTSVESIIYKLFLVCIRAGAKPKVYECFNIELYIQPNQRNSIATFGLRPACVLG
mmetsp:Transcript_32828/g.57357  ORF Transcript_32828/g.57357 Transcript_32828/m.57357 type:complete len:92 (-) Transcript_32828:1700-1975(-)